jgi:hypothetical protein
LCKKTRKLKATRVPSHIGCSGGIGYYGIWRKGVGKIKNKKLIITLLALY